jgi:alpha/beta hydrolase family protein
MHARHLAPPPAQRNGVSIVVEEAIGTEPFESFQTVRLTGAGAQVSGGWAGPDLPYCWSLVAPRLAKYFTIVALDLRGYGESDAPEVDLKASAYSKRAMAADLRAS